uniref:Putative secreted protein n=1 Tax=Anopheles marajoara TaxID=58244 RepID=A0A2M4C663_9DIPT
MLQKRQNRVVFFCCSLTFLSRTESEHWGGLTKVVVHTTGDGDGDDVVVCCSDINSSHLSSDSASINTPTLLLPPGSSTAGGPGSRPTVPTSITRLLLFSCPPRRRVHHTYAPSECNLIHYPPPRSGGTRTSVRYELSFTLLFAYLWCLPEHERLVDLRWW